ncbi:ExeA family protein [Thermodesulfobacteriota bacterium]
MYRSFYGLQRKPFELKPDGNCVYLSDTHEEAIANLEYGVDSEKGFLMLTGGVGTGKTTVLNALLATLDDRVRVCLINNPKLEVKEFYRFMANLLGLQYNDNKAEFIIQFLTLLEHCAEQNEKILLMIDEAQFFTVDLMDEVRLLANHAGNRDVLSIFFIGQPELLELLAHDRLLPLRQRIELRYHLSELTRDDTTQYISFRLKRAGATESSIFSTEAIDSIHQATRGNPRLINVVCDHALIAGFIQEKQTIGREVIVECLREIRLPGESGLQLAPVESLSEYESSHANGRGQQKTVPLLRNAVIGLLLLALAGSVLYFSYQRGWLLPGGHSTKINIGTLQVK